MCALLRCIVEGALAPPPPHKQQQQQQQQQGSRGGSHPPRTPSAGAVLVFLHGWEEITSIASSMGEDSVLGNPSRVLTLPLHSQVPSSEQRRCFRPAPPGVTKVILATNIAETSITIEDVVYVIDAGKVKEKRYDAYSGCSSLEPQWVSQASARQRAGRAGRVRAGYAFHLFSRLRFTHLSEFTEPEMLRTNIEELCLSVKALLEPGGSSGGGGGGGGGAAAAAGFLEGGGALFTPGVAPLPASGGQVQHFLSRALSPPQPHAIASALGSLRAQGALTRRRLPPPLLCPAAAPLAQRRGGGQHHLLGAAAAPWVTQTPLRP